MSQMPPSPNLFISWSGSWAHEVAKTLHEWIPGVLRKAEPWISSEDIAKGMPWDREIDRILGGVSAGIFVTTPHSLESPWVAYEAGAVSRALESRVCTFLCGVANPVAGPLGRFQSTLPVADDVLRMLKSLDVHLAGKPTERLGDWFRRDWPELDSKLVTIASKYSDGKLPEVKPKPEVILGEVLASVRKVEKSIEDVRLQVVFSKWNEDEIANWVPELSWIPAMEAFPPIKLEVEPNLGKSLRKENSIARREAFEAIRALIQRFKDRGSPGEGTDRRTEEVGLFTIEFQAFKHSTMTKSPSPYWMVRILNISRNDLQSWLRASMLPASGEPSSGNSEDA